MGISRYNNYIKWFFVATVSFVCGGIGGIAGGILVTEHAMPRNRNVARNIYPDKPLQFRGLRFEGKDIKAMFTGKILLNTLGDTLFDECVHHFSLEDINKALKKIEDSGVLDSRASKASRAWYQEWRAQLLESKQWFLTARDVLQQEETRPAQTGKSRQKKKGLKKGSKGKQHSSRCLPAQSIRHAGAFVQGQDFARTSRFADGEFRHKTLGQYRPRCGLT